MSTKRTKGAQARLARACASGIETLEQRRLLSVAVLGYGSTLYVTGNYADDNVSIWQDQASNQTIVTEGANVWNFSRIFSQMNISLDGGQDRLGLFYASDLVGKYQTIKVNLGGGGDTFVFESPLQDSSLLVPVGDGGDLVNSNVNICIDGGAGADNFVLDLETTSLQCSRLTFDIQGGYGTTPDLLQMTLPSYNEGEAIADYSRLAIAANLGAGNDNVILHALTDIKNGSEVKLDLFTGEGDDVVEYATENNLTGYLSLGLLGPAPSKFISNVYLGNGANEFEGTIDFGSGGTVIQSGSTLKLNTIGGYGVDDIDYVLDSFTGGSSAPITGLLDLSATTGAGADEIEIGGEDHEPGNALFDVTAAGRLRVFVDAGAGNDDAFVNLATTFSSAGLYDLFLYGGYGDDTLGLRFQNNGVHTAANFPFLSPLLSGGPGTDTYDVDGNVNDFITIQGAEIEDDNLLPGG